MEISSFSAIETEFMIPGPARKKKCRKIREKSIKISRMRMLQTTHSHPKKSVAKSERNPSKSLALIPGIHIPYEPASYP